MWAKPTKAMLAKVPKLYSTEKIKAKDKMIYLHFFIGACDWYIAEYDGKDMFFGFAILNNDLQNAEWGYVSFSELKELNVRGFEVDTDKYWDVRKAIEVSKIVAANGV